MGDYQRMRKENWSTLRKGIQQPERTPSSSQKRNKEKANHRFSRSKYYWRCRNSIHNSNTRERKEHSKNGTTSKYHRKAA
jgi:hypothetical protein